MKKFEGNLQELMSFYNKLAKGFKELRDNLLADDEILNKIKEKHPSESMDLDIIINQEGYIVIVSKSENSFYSRHDIVIGVQNNDFVIVKWWDTPLALKSFYDKYANRNGKENLLVVVNKYLHSFKDYFYQAR